MLLNGYMKDENNWEQFPRKQDNNGKSRKQTRQQLNLI